MMESVILKPSINQDTTLHLEQSQQLERDLKIRPRHWVVQLGVEDFDNSRQPVIQGAAVNVENLCGLHGAASRVEIHFQRAKQVSPVFAQKPPQKRHVWVAVQALRPGAIERVKIAEIVKVDRLAFTRTFVAYS